MGDDKPVLARSKLRQRTANSGSALFLTLKDMQAKFLLPRLRSVFEQVDDVFFDLADRAENSHLQTVYFDAMRMIRLEQGNIEQAFTNSLNAAFQCLIDPGAALTPEGVDSSVPRSQLEVVDNDELEEMIALDTMVSRSMEQCQPELGLLSERLDYVADIAVNQKNNPVGPEAICDAFGLAIKILPLDIRSKLVLLKLFDRQVLQMLRELIVECNQSLIKQNILPDLEIRRKLKKPVAANVARPQKPKAGDDPQKDKPEVTGTPKKSTSRIVSLLTSWLDQTESGQAIAEAGQGQPEVQLADVFSAISTMQARRSNHGFNDLEMKRGSTMGSLQNQLAEAGLAGNLRPMDKGIVRLIDTLFAQLDRHLQASRKVAQQLLKLELPILRVALQDHEFFDKEKHPARRLLNEVAQASMAFHEDEDISGDPVAQYISKMADSLVNEESIDNAKLAHLLAGFLELVERDRRRSASLEQRLLEQVAASERVNEAHRTVEGILQERLLGKELPKVLVDFAEQAWCKILFMDCLKSASNPKQLEQNTALLDQMLSLVDKEDEQVTATLDQLLPVVRDKLSGIAYDAYQAGCLIGGIEQYFSAKQQFRSAQAIASAESDNKPAASDRQQAAESVGRQLNELLEQVLVEKVQADLPGQVEDEEPEEEGEELSEESLLILESLCRGSWVESRGEGARSERCKVAGIVASSGKFIFVNRRGAKVSEKNRRRVALEIEQGKLIVLDNSHLFDDVLESVIRDINNTRAAS